MWHFATPWAVVCQVPLSIEFSRQEYWNGLPFPFPGNLPDPGIKPRFPPLQADSLLSEPPVKWKNISKWCENWKIFLILKNWGQSSSYSLESKAYSSPVANSVHFFQLSASPLQSGSELDGVFVQNVKQLLHLLLLLCCYHLRLHNENAWLLKCQSEHDLIRKCAV